MIWYENIHSDLKCFIEIVAWVMAMSRYNLQEQGGTRACKMIDARHVCENT